MNPTYIVDADITQATTIAGDFYRDEAAYALARQRVFARSWQWIGDSDEIALGGTMIDATGQTYPVDGGYAPAL